MNEICLPFEFQVVLYVLHNKMDKRDHRLCLQSFGPIVHFVFSLFLNYLYGIQCISVYF